MKIKNKNIIIVSIVTALIIILAIVLFLMNNKKEIEKSFSIEDINIVGDNITEYDELDDYKFSEKCLFDHNSEIATEYCFLGFKNNSDDYYTLIDHDDNFFINANNKENEKLNIEEYIKSNKEILNERKYDLFNSRTTTINVDNKYNIDVIYIIYMNSSSHNPGSKLLLHIEDNANNVYVEYSLNNKAMSFELVDKLINSFVLKEHQANYKKGTITGNDINVSLFIIKDKKYQLDYKIDSNKYFEETNKESQNNKVSFTSNNKEVGITIELFNSEKKYKELFDELLAIVEDMELYEYNDNYQYKDKVLSMIFYKQGNAYYKQYIYEMDEGIDIKYEFSSSSKELLDNNKLEELLNFDIKIIEQEKD